MATKNISITEKAYKKLKMLKEKEESFSEAIERITSKYSDITSLSGEFPEIAEVEDELQEERKEFKTREVEKP